MPHRHDADQLRKIAFVRGLQRMAAEANTARASVVLREREAAEQAREQMRTALEDEWQASLNSARLQVETLASWASALLESENDVRRAAANVNAARVNRDRRAGQWRDAIRQDESAAAVARQETRAEARREEEAFLLEATDFFLGRWGAR